MGIHKKYEEIKFFLEENTRGGVTVFICLVLIPVMMFTGLMTDLARIKLFHSEAAGAADGYADAVLSQYDELLYNVYGLLSITQDEEGLKALEVIKEYMQSAYDPSSAGKVTNASQSDLKYIPDNIVFIGMNNADMSNLWAPYGNTQMTLGREIDQSGSNGANLSNKYIFSNQVCDYMKVIGPVDLAWNGLTDAIDSGNKTKENAEMMNERKEVDNLYNNLDGKLKNLYNAVDSLNGLNEWEVPQNAVSYACSFNDMYNALYANYVKLAGGTAYSISENEDSCVLGDLFNKAINELQNDEDGGVNTELFNTWVSEINSGSVSGNNYLYEICRIRAEITADSAARIENYENPCTGTLYNIKEVVSNSSGLRRTYAFKSIIEEHRAEINRKFDALHDNLNNGLLPFFLNSVVTVLGGGENLMGFQTDGINSVAAEAESKRGNFVNKCRKKEGVLDGDGNYTNPMAHGLAEEYSFTEEGAEEMKFVGEFNYNWLKDKYQNNFTFLQKLDEYITADRNYLNAKFDDLENDIFSEEGHTTLVKYLDSKIADLESYANGGLNADSVKWRYDYSSNVSSVSDSSNLTYSNLDSVKARLAYDNVEWFDITSSERKSGDPDFPKLWGILEKWYSSGGKSEQAEAKTTHYKELLKKLKKSITDRGDAGKELIEKFNDVSIPNCINVSDKNDSAPDQSVASLFGDEGNFDTTIKTESNARNSDYYITKLLMMDYDWNFFTDATYGKHPDDNGKNKLRGKSLKGEELTEKTNYLLRRLEDNSLAGAELEYIYWGNRDAQKNIKAVRNQIMVIRAVENFASTYTIKEINEAINAIRSALSGIPIAALIVPPLIRAAVAMAETYFDLQALYEGKSIALYKSKLSHLTILNDPETKKILDEMFTSEEDKQSPLAKKGGGDDSDKPIEFNYSQFVILVTMLFCDTSTIIQRTQDLVELNINHRLGVKMASDESDDLKFRLSKASVAVKSTCKIDKMNLLILGGVFNNESVDGYISEDKLDVLEDGFSYTVYRSY